MRTKNTPPGTVKKDTLPLSWVLVGVGFLLAIVLLIVLVVNRMNKSQKKQMPTTLELLDHPTNNQSNDHKQR